MEASVAPQLAAHKGLRRDILIALKHAQPQTVRDLSDRLEVTANAVRHHLKELEAEGLVAYAREQRGIGAPSFAYRLSEAGEALFPKRYEGPLTRLLRHIVATEGRAAAVAVLEEEYAELAGRLRVELDGRTPEERIEAVARVMGEAGYMAEWQASGGAFRLTEHNCAIRAVAERFPEICDAEERFFRTVLTADVTRRAHIVRGCNACEYAVTFDRAASGTPAEHPASEERE